MNNTNLSLDKIRVGESCKVVKINAKSSPTVNRLFDFGIVNGVIITPEFRSIGGGITAYRVYSGLLAIRDEDAKNIYTTDIKGGDSNVSEQR